MRIGLLICINCVLWLTIPAIHAKTASAELSAISLQLPWKHQFEFAGFYAAIEQGYYQELGLDVTIKEYQNKLDLIDEVVNGRAQYGVGLSSLVIDRSQGAPVVLLANIFQHSPLVLLSHAESKIYSPVQMIGKSIMLASFEKDNASLVAMLNSESVSLDQMDVKEHTFNLEDFITGKVDVVSAYMTNEPEVLKERQVKFNIIDPINYGIDFYGDNIFTSEKQLRDHPEQVAHFVKASLKGWRYALDHPEEIIELILKKYSNKKNRQALIYEAETLERFILPDYIELGTIDLERLRRIIDTYKQLKMLPNTFTLDGFVYQTPSKAFSLDLTEQEQNWIWLNPEVVIGIDPAWAPFEFIDEQGRYSGMGADYIHLIAEKTGLKFVVQNNLNWQLVMENVRNGTLDLLPAVMKSQQRSEYLNFSSPHIKYPMVIVTGKDEAFISSLEQLNNKQVAVVKGYVTEDILRTNHPGISLKTAKNLQQALKMVSSAEVDAVVDNLASLSYTIAELGISNLRISGTIPYEFALGIAVLKQHKILLAIIQKALDSISKEKQTEIRNKWISLNYQQAPDYEKIIIISVVVVIFILFILFWNWRLAREVKARKQAEQALHNNQKILEFRNAILELLAKGTHLKTVLEMLVQNLQESNPEMIGSILLLDEQKKHLVNGITISLPAFYMQAVNGLKIGMGVGSCGTVAYTGERLIVEDVMTHPYWEKYRELTQKAGIRACWAEPVLSSKGEMLGTFAIYYREPKAPTESDLKLIHDFSILTTLAIENFRSNELLKKLSLAVEQSANGVVITDKKGIIEYINPKFTEVTGYQQEEAIGQTPRILKSNKMDEAVYSDLWKTLFSGKKWQGEFCNRKKNGQLYWTWGNIAPILNDLGEIAYFVAVQEDITARREVEQALRISEAQYRNLVESSHVIAWEVDLESFCFTYVSPYAEKMLGYPLEQWKKENFWEDHVVEGDRLASLFYCINETKEGRDHDFEYRMIKSNGDSIWLRNIVTIVRGIEENPVSLRGVLIDIDGIKKAEERLEKAKLDAEQANKFKSEFLATMSHELRTPMNGVLGMAQILEQSELTNEQHHFVDIILHSGNSLLAIINDVLDFSKLEAGQWVLEKRSFNLEQLSRDVLDMFLAETKNKKLQIRLDYSHDYPRYFEGDPLRIQQILINLIGNAVKFTNDGGVDLIVSCKSLEYPYVELTLSIKDTGIGIAAENMAHLFDPFIQADQSTTRQFGGTGLGLAISEKLISLMGGKIGVDSELGQGSRFWITLFLSEIDEDAFSRNQKTKTLNKSLANNKVLLVEDDKINQLVAVSLLTKLGLQVDVAENGRQAIALWQHADYDLIFMDCRMPVMDGYEATRAIREQETEKTIPIIALTAISSAEGKQQGIKSGMNDVITKPFNKEYLVKILNKWLNSDNQSKAGSEHHVPSDMMIPEHESGFKLSSLDHEVLEKFRVEMGNDYAEIFTTILQGFKDFFTQFEGHVTLEKNEEFARAAHNLKSRAAYLGAIKICTIASEIEVLADNKELEKAGIKMQQLRQEYEFVLVELAEV